MATKEHAASGADRGLFQKPPVLSNQFHSDAAFQRCFCLFLSDKVAAQATPEVAEIGSKVLSDQVFAWVTDAERNKPYIKGSGRDAFGNAKAELVTSEGWRQLQRLGQAMGMVATGYDTDYGRFSRPLQFLRLHLWEPSCANVTCPSAMQDGAARLLQRHLTKPELSKNLSMAQGKVFKNAFDHLTSRDPDFAWTSGQWMTERTGGSDVSRTETTAVSTSSTGSQLASKQEGIPLGPWSISGFKWFASAADSQMSILLAKTSGGLSTFLAPTRKHDPTATTLTGVSKDYGDCPNGMRIQRLKEKLGTNPLPSAELVLEDMRGWMIGQEGRGIQEISTVLILTRIHSAVAALGYVGRGLAIARAYARVREIGAGKGARILLMDSPLHMHTLATMTAEYRGLMLLVTFTSYILGVSEHPGDCPLLSPGLRALTPISQHVEPLLRVLTQLTKAYVCKSALPLLFSCMESLGGVGYLANVEQQYLNVARLYRDCCVLPIWEGTTDVLCTDFIRALKHPKSGQESIAALESFVQQASSFRGEGACPPSWDPLARWKAVKDRVGQESQEQLLIDARGIVWTVAKILISVLLYVDASTDGDAVANDVLHRFVREKFAKNDSQAVAVPEQLRRDVDVVFGEDKAVKTKL